MSQSTTWPSWPILSIALLALCASSTHAAPPQHAPLGYNDTCVSAAPFIAAVETYTAASQFCYDWLNLTRAQTTTYVSTEYTRTTVTITTPGNTGLVTASASAQRVPFVTAPYANRTSLVIANQTATVTGNTTITAFLTPSPTTVTSTTTLCGNQTAAQAPLPMTKRDGGHGWRHGWGASSNQWHGGHPGWGQGGGPNWRNGDPLPPPIEGFAEARISSGCRCMSLPTGTLTTTTYVTETSTSTHLTNIPALSAGQPIYTFTNTTAPPPETSTVTPTLTVWPTTYITASSNYTVVETTTVLVGPQTGAPTVVLARPTPITGVDEDGLATANFDDELYPIEIPFDLEVYGVRSRNLVVSVNGWIALSNDSGSFDHYGFDNSELPANNSNDDFGLPSTVFLPYWNDLYVYDGTAQGLYYEIAGEAPQRNVSFEWYTSLYLQPTGYYHFIATFREDQPGAAVYTYYQANGEMPQNTLKYGTIGVQAVSTDDHSQYSYNRLVAPGLEITYEPASDVFRQTNVVSCEA